LNEEPRSAAHRFAFGENWARFAEQIDESRIARAEDSLGRLLGRKTLEGLSFLDIGSGSGVHSLAAIRLGATRVLAIDIDPVSVDTTRHTLSAAATETPWSCRQLSVFDLDPAETGSFDVVYSWGVLHHTGALHDATRVALRCLAPGGLAVLAVYRKTPFCGFWAAEKRWYAGASAGAQRFARGCYITLMAVAMAIRGRSPSRYIRDYPANNRGMDYHRDVHDWMGGYPYESITPAEMTALMAGEGLVEVRSFTRAPGTGLFGSGNDEYVFQRAGEP
jgi:2-polyprenyl-6-hydroxyphenyl methylase/3-demethylubiquinone-9 3-methyltransferase